MPVPHLNIRIVQRSKGNSAVAGAAYQAGEKLFSEYDQKHKDHRRKQHEVVYTEIMLPTNALASLNNSYVQMGYWHFSSSPFSLMWA